METNRKPSRIVIRKYGESHQEPCSGSQPRLANPIKTVLYILGVLVDQNTFPAFNCETGVDPQHLCCLFPGLLKLS